MAVEHSATLSLRTEISFPSRSILLLIFASPSLLRLSSYPSKQHGSSIIVHINIIVIDVRIFIANIVVLVIAKFD
jgi:hypothetical protein